MRLVQGVMGVVLASAGLVSCTPPPFVVQSCYLTLMTPQRTVILPSRVKLAVLAQGDRCLLPTTARISISGTSQIIEDIEIPNVFTWTWAAEDFGLPPDSSRTVRVQLDAEFADGRIYRIYEDFTVQNPEEPGELTSHDRVMSE
jgi:hypothetical protein